MNLPTVDQSVIKYLEKQLSIELEISVDSDADSDEGDFLHWEWESVSLSNANIFLINNEFLKKQKMKFLNFVKNVFDFTSKVFLKIVIFVH